MIVADAVEPSGVQGFLDLWAVFGPLAGAVVGAGLGWLGQWFAAKRDRNARHQDRDFTERRVAYSNMLAALDASIDATRALKRDIALNKEIYAAELALNKHLKARVKGDLEATPDVTANLKRDAEILRKSYKRRKVGADASEALNTLKACAREIELVGGSAILEYIALKLDILHGTVETELAPDLSSVHAQLVVLMRNDLANPAPTRRR